MDGNEVEMEAWMAHETAAHSGSLVGRVVVEHEVEDQVGGRGRADVFYKFEDLSLRVARLALANDFDSLHVERGEQRNRAMVEVVMRAALGSASRVAFLLAGHNTSSTSGRDWWRQTRRQRDRDSCG